MKTLTFKTILLAFSLVVVSNNVFCQNDTDNRMKIRLGFSSVNNLHRQILVTVDSNSTPGIDFGYDAENFENHIDDMYWMIDDRKFLIQGINEIDENTILPLGLHTATSGENIISIEELVNVPDDFEIGVLDNNTNTYYNLKESNSFSIDLPAGEYLNRFELIFVNDDGSNEDDSNEDDSNADVFSYNDQFNYNIETENKALEINFINRIKSISIKNIHNRTIKSVKIYTLNGLQTKEYTNINAEDQALIKTYNLNAGNYILIITTDYGTLTKKIIIK